MSIIKQHHKATPKPYTSKLRKTEGSMMSCCETRRLNKPENNMAIIEVPGTSDHNTPWKFYNHLIAGIPEDILVKDCCVGTHWSYLEAECGLGLSYTLTGGGRPVHDGKVDGLPLREVAQLAKSWNFREATIGVAALNAWYSAVDKVAALGGRISPEQSGQDSDTSGYDKRQFDPFFCLQDAYRNKKVTVIGHFPGVEEMAEICNLTVLERNPRSPLDTPDPGCEYILPSQDYIFTTGVTIINKTAPRLLDLGSNARFIFVGPSVIPSEFLFKWGVTAIAGRIVTDFQRAKLAVKQGASFTGAASLYYLSQSD